MNEKIAVDDLLSNTNTIITLLNYSMEQADNKNFLDTLKNHRNKLEDIHWQIYLIAKEKEYYVPAAPGGAADIEQVKNVICKK